MRQQVTQLYAWIRRPVRALVGSSSSNRGTADRPYLEVRGPGAVDEVRTVVLMRERATIGRDPGNTIVLPDPDQTISKHEHCVIHFLPGSGWCVQDKSTNGTYLKHHEWQWLVQQTVALSNGDIIGIKLRASSARRTPEWQLTSVDPTKTHEDRSVSRLVLDLEEHRLFRLYGDDRQAIALAPREVLLLGHMQERSQTLGAPATCTTLELSRAVYGRDELRQSDIAKLVFSLRQKVELDPEDPQHLVKAAGGGYKLILRPMPRQLAGPASPADDDDA